MSLQMAHRTGVPSSLKTPTSLGPPWGPRHRPTIGSEGGAVSYERGAPVGPHGFTPGFTFEIMDLPQGLLSKLWIYPRFHLRKQVGVEGEAANVRAANDAGWGLFLMSEVPL